jgi:hypothetical protein
MNTLIKNDVNILKCIAFVFILFPFISHIYSVVFPILYDFSIAKIGILIIILTVITSTLSSQNEWYKIRWHKDIIYFAPFLLVALASSIYNYDLYVTKYVAYIFIYFYCIKRFFLHNFIFKLYVNILVITFLILIVIYFLALNIDLYTPYRVENLDGLSKNSAMHTVNHRAQIFYLLVFEQSDYSGIFNIPRFFGFSREPGMYVMFIVPGLLIAHFFKMKFQVFILGCAILITSSFAGFFVLLILFFLAILPSKHYKTFMFIMLALLAIEILFSKEFLSFVQSDESFWGSRIVQYVYYADRTISRYVYELSSFSFSGILFLSTKLSYLLILYYFYRKIKIINLRIVLMFFIAFVLLINKATELLSPLFIFYLSFIDYIYITKMREQSKLT